MLIVFFFACLWGTPDEVPEPPAPVVEPEPMAADPSPPERAEPELQVDAELTALTNTAASTKVAEATAAFNSATTAEQLHEAYVLANQAADLLTTWAEGAEMGADMDAVTERTTGITMGWFAEGTAAVFYLDPEAWKAKAATTDGQADDTWFDLVSYVYDQGNPGGWAVWEMRNWDYGGCSGLGKGVVLETMTKAQAAANAGDAFASEVAEVRAAAIREITRTGPSTFRRCDIDSTEPMSDEALQGEVQSILDQITLTEAERDALTAAKPQLHGE